MTTTYVRIVTDGSIGAPYLVQTCRASDGLEHDDIEESAWKTVGNPVGYDKIKNAFDVIPDTDRNGNRVVVFW